MIEANKLEAKANLGFCTELSGIFHHFEVILIQDTQTPLPLAACLYRPRSVMKARRLKALSEEPS